jgi:hypothetical protein
MSGYTANIIEPHGVFGEEVHFLQKPSCRHDLTAAIWGHLRVDMAIFTLKTYLKVEPS